MDIGDGFQQKIDVVREGGDGQRLGHDGLGRIGLDRHGQNDAISPAATSTESEIQLGILAGTGRDCGAIGQEDLRIEDLIGGETVVPARWGMTSSLYISANATHGLPVSEYTRSVMFGKTYVGAPTGSPPPTTVKFRENASLYTSSQT